ncbi:hypothetical protein LCGC14_1476470 [marine sediment metagenome]|uniref:Uncharacterized protein n=1 Tax=marine sediment metagenome TaxID=412755 RepID=A0A0F9JWT0_9ZZZZ
MATLERLIPQFMCDTGCGFEAQYRLRNRHGVQTGLFCANCRLPAQKLLQERERILAGSAAPREASAD